MDWVMALGYCFGAVVTQAPKQRHRISALLGIASLGAFVLLRLTHSYGDPGPSFEHLNTPIHSMMSFFSVQKYPPSLHYLLATLGIVFLLFSIFDRAAEHARTPRLRAFFEVYGRVLFFFYILHIFLIHTLALIVAASSGANWRFWITPDVVFTSHLTGWGYSLSTVYTVCIAVVFVLYPVCAWFSHLKDRRRDWWLAYLYAARIPRHRSVATRDDKARPALHPYKHEVDVRRELPGQDFSQGHKMDRRRETA